MFNNAATINNTSKEQFINDCKNQYGENTYLLIESYKDAFDAFSLAKEIVSSTVNRKELFQLIPNLLYRKYTVIVIEITGLEKNSQHLQITAVHLPAQSFLTIPPIIP